MANQLSNSEITHRVQSIFTQSTVMFIYFCGSKAYGTNDVESDSDITVILDGFKGMIHLELGDYDIFAFGADTFLLKQVFDPAIPSYYRASVDEIISIDHNLIYLNETYRDEFEAYKNVNMIRNLGAFLDSFIEYHQYRLADGIPKKTHYHILRMRGTLEHLDLTGRFEHFQEEPWKTQMMYYKKNWNTDLGNEYIPTLKEALAYIENYKEKVMNDELGKHPQSI